MGAAFSGTASRCPPGVRCGASMSAAVKGARPNRTVAASAEAAGFQGRRLRNQAAGPPAWVGPGESPIASGPTESSDRPVVRGMPVGGVVDVLCTVFAYLSASLTKVRLRLCRRLDQPCTFVAVPANQILPKRSTTFPERVPRPQSPEIGAAGHQRMLAGWEQRGVGDSFH
jgi:hypothetical protein